MSKAPERNMTDVLPCMCQLVTYQAQAQGHVCGSSPAARPSRLDDPCQHTGGRPCLHMSALLHDALQQRAQPIPLIDSASMQRAKLLVSSQRCQSSWPHGSSVLQPVLHMCIRCMSACLLLQDAA